MKYSDLIKLLEPYKDLEVKFTGCAFNDKTSVEFYDGMTTLFSLNRKMGTTDITIKVNNS